MIRWFSRKKNTSPPPALFMHIQKTAGTSLVNMARRYYGNDAVSHGDCWGKPPEQFRDIGFISGHLGYSYISPLMDRRFSFTFLRDPIERVLSMYYFCRSRDPAEFEIYRKAHELSLTDFLAAGLTDPVIRTRIWNNQVWQLAHGYTHLDALTPDNFTQEALLTMAKSHLLEFSYVGFTETFSADAGNICSILKFAEQDTGGRQILMENVTPQRPRFEDQPTAVQKLLNSITELDQEFYDYARRSVIGPET